MEYRLTKFEDLTVGKKAAFAKTITEADISHFVAVTGDVNQLHVDRQFARRTFFGKRICHGMLTASLFSTIVGMLLPGTGAIYRSQSLTFVRPVFIGDTLTASFEIVRIERERERIEMDGVIRNQEGEEVLRGVAVVSLLRQVAEA
jgi:3-hydroxybutyryl-CoA dehydratase